MLQEIQACLMPLVAEKKELFEKNQTLESRISELNFDRNLNTELIKRTEKMANDIILERKTLRAYKDSYSLYQYGKLQNEKQSSLIIKMQHDINALSTKHAEYERYTKQLQSEMEDVSKDLTRLTKRNAYLEKTHMSDESSEQSDDSGRSDLGETTLDPQEILDDYQKLEVMMKTRNEGMGKILQVFQLGFEKKDDYFRRYKKMRSLRMNIAHPTTTPITLNDVIPLLDRYA
jgi:hypothetical protein